MLDINYYAKLGLATIFEKVLAKERLSEEDGLQLFACPDINALGALANHARYIKHKNIVSFVVNHQINYTNICVNNCTFCAFKRQDQSEPGAFLLSKEEILERLQVKAGALEYDEVHIVGGCHPTIKLQWFIDLFQDIKKLHPNLPLKAFTCVEIDHFAKLEGIETIEVLKQLKKAGLVMLTGGGAEIFDENVRQQLCPYKTSGEKWLSIAGEAHSLGIQSNCSMLFGHIEDAKHRVDHLCRLRKQQDQSGGFLCFIPLSFQTDNSRLIIPEERKLSFNALEQLKTIAVSRLLLDNIPHIKAYWIMLGEKLAQTALWFGADDIDGTIVEEHIGHMAGANSPQAMGLQHLEFIIKNSGFTPLRRNATFKEVG